MDGKLARIEPVARVKIAASPCVSRSTDDWRTGLIFALSATGRSCYRFRILGRDNPGTGVLQIIGTSLDGLPWFLAYLATAVVLTLIYVIVYMWVTPHPEIKLIRENNLSASLAFSGSLVGFSLPLASAIANSVALVDCVVWGLIAIVVQIVIFYLVRLPIPQISDRIEKGEMASGLWLGAASLTGGLLNAASMTS